MMARLAIGRVEPWELVLSLGLLIATVPLVTLLAIRVYRAGVAALRPAAHGRGRSSGRSAAGRGLGRSAAAWRTTGESSAGGPCGASSNGQPRGTGRAPGAVPARSVRGLVEPRSQPRVRRRGAAGRRRAPARRPGSTATAAAHPRQVRAATAGARARPRSPAPTPPRGAPDPPRRSPGPSPPRRRAAARAAAPPAASRAAARAATSRRGGAGRTRGTRPAGPGRPDEPHAERVVVRAAPRIGHHQLPVEHRGPRPPPGPPSPASSGSTGPRSTPRGSTIRTSPSPGARNRADERERPVPAPRRLEQVVRRSRRRRVEGVGHIGATSPGRGSAASSRNVSCSAIASRW